MKTRSMKAAMALGALMTYLAPKMAQDAKVDLAPIVDGVDSKNFGERKAGIVEAVTAATKDKLAKDAKLDDLTQLLDALQEQKTEEPERDADGADAYDAEGAGKIGEFLRSKGVAEDVCSEVDKMLGGPGGAKDEDPDKKPDMVEKPAMDAAIRAATEKAQKDSLESARKEQRAIRDAERLVRPYVGELAMDSVETADDVFRSAFKVLGVDVKDVHPSAFPALLKAQKVPGSAGAEPRIAMDSDSVADFKKDFPQVARLSA